ncbi:hypothetical protein MXD61_06875 [Frankia sp. AgPm24]|uniref:hypothetical protein n=1 Tax=Frankia sp. AgPm24 TaxID=631128 RepID=UPI00200E2732|nr:hypothetical protein [Frankia sp. AgPm24]MCK9921614.1 hypothetical protein [Frankia sp. AgPm24]
MAATQAGGQTGAADEAALIASPQGQAFVTAFRAAYPQLSTNRLDKHIVRNGSRVCSDITEAGREVALRRLPLRVAYNGVTPDATQSQAIFDLAVAHFCPGR